ncbi:MAG: hypothetical protein ACRCUY_08480 [Thermoguttaceae bacterium]
MTIAPKIFSKPATLGIQHFMARSKSIVEPPKQNRRLTPAARQTKQPLSTKAG